MIPILAEGERQPGVVLVTAESEEQARAIAQTVVQEGLAACANLFPVRSIYRWQGEVQDGEEWQLVIKTDLRLFEALAARVGALHTYDVPEIIAVAIALGSSAYLDWLEESCGGEGLGRNL